MNVSAKAKERFCKDCNIPIKLFQEPYFTDRLILFDAFYDTLKKWNLFLEELQKYDCEQDYFEEYNRVKDAAINSIKNSEAYQKFNAEDMNQCRIPSMNHLPDKHIFKSTNDGRTFISIDMQKANFSSLQHYGNCKNQSMFSGASSWEEFLGIFTNNKHIINSKYIRQVILGNCNPKRHITYEKWIMYSVLHILNMELIALNRTVFFSNDEIVLDISDMDESSKNAYLIRVQDVTERIAVPLKVEMFTLHKIHGTDGYYKKIFDGSEKGRIEFKCLDNYMMPFVARYFLGEEVTDSDKMFCYEGHLAQFVEVPKIEERGE